MMVKQTSTKMTLVATVLAASVAVFAAAQAVGAQPSDLVFPVTEGVTYQATPKEVREKFEPLVELIGKTVHRSASRMSAIGQSRSGRFAPKSRYSNSCNANRGD